MSLCKREIFHFFYYFSPCFFPVEKQPHLCYNLSAVRGEAGENPARARRREAHRSFVLLPDAANREQAIAAKRCEKAEGKVPPVEIP